MKLGNLFKQVDLKDVFTPGGQPSITYVDRQHLGIEASLRKAISLPTTIVSLTGPTKSGKTVLCTSVLGDFEYVWIDGGQVKSEDKLWTKICAELKLACEISEKSLSSTQGQASVAPEASAGAPANYVKVGITLNGSRLKSVERNEKHLPDNMSQAIDALVQRNICLVVDDFHYVDDDTRASLIRSLKGAVYKGLKVVFLSTPHRAFEAIKAESEVTGRFKHVTVPVWSKEDLRLIATTGFEALNVECSSNIIDLLVEESEGSPLLMQRFCWNICFDSGVEKSVVKRVKISDFDLNALFNEVAEDAGMPIYEKLAKGPQSRTDRIRRPLANGQTADIYEAILLAVAKTGPQSKLSYDQIRSSLTDVLLDKIPQKLEVSNALNHLNEIDSEQNRGQRAVDWDAQNLNLFITDPFFRFYLRWRVATQ